MWNVVVSMTCALGSEVNVLLNACCVHSLMAVLKMERSIQPNMDPPPPSHSPFQNPVTASMVAYVVMVEVVRVQ